MVPCNMTPAATSLRRWARGRVIVLLWYENRADRKWQWQIKLRPYIILLHSSINEDLDTLFTVSHRWNFWDTYWELQN